MQFGGPSQCTKNTTWQKLHDMRVPVPIMQEPCSLSISTRGIGLMLAYMIPKLTDLSTKYDTDDEPIYHLDFPLAAAYRASLAQLEAKIYFAKDHQSAPFSYRSGTEYSFFGPSKICSKWSFSRNRNIGALALLINSIGHVEINGKHFEPRFLSKLSPLNIRISNLRKYCVDMSNLETAASERVAGYELNSIPHAKWEFNNPDDPQSVYLDNPDEIIPADYNDNSMHNDFIKLEEWLNVLLSGEKNYLRGRIDYMYWGDPGILASTQVVPGRSIRVKNGSVDVKSDFSYVHFWSREPLEHLSWATGAMTLAGEILDPTIPSQRSPSLAIEKYSTRWRAVARILG